MKNISIILFSLFLSFFAKAQSPDNFTVNGSVSCMSGFPIAGVQLTLKNDTTIIATTTSDGNGAFGFTQVPTSGTEYTVEASFNDGNPLDGISTFDMVMMQQQLLGRQDLSVPQVLAMDFNRSGKLSTMDILQLRLLILFALQGNQLPSPDWIFYSDIGSNVEVGPFSVPASGSDVMLVLKGIKRGDINNSNTTCR